CLLGRNQAARQAACGVSMEQLPFGSPDRSAVAGLINLAESTSRSDSGTDIMTEALAVMAKAPVEGRVKTRLIGAPNAATAAELYVAFLSDTCAVMEEVRDEREAGAEETDEDYTF